MREENEAVFVKLSETKIRALIAQNCFAVEIETGWRVGELSKPIDESVWRHEEGNWGYARDAGSAACRMGRQGGGSCHSLRTIVGTTRLAHRVQELSRSFSFRGWTRATVDEHGKEAAALHIKGSKRSGADTSRKRINVLQAL
jgi:hypothetical protein